MSMRVLIAAQKTALTEIWGRHLQRAGLLVSMAEDAERAVRSLNHEAIDIVIVNLSHDRGDALTIADYAGYRRPSAKVIFVTSSTFFSDGSIFHHVTNAAVMLPEDTSAEDLLAVVEHYGASDAGEAARG